ncbi:MAG: hypothetical protein GX102_09980 [Porphyromonadaceae bacterium]|nr:hypothetical protein [Porphyromonadaceae bacterium]
MNKENTKITIPEIIDLMVARGNVSKKIADEYIRVLISTIEDALLSGDFVRVRGFGTFKPQWNEARRSVDVNTGNEIIIPGFYRVVFTPDNDLKALINRPFAHLETIVLSDSESDISQEGDADSAIEDESIGIKDDSNLTFFSSQAAEIKEILSDINALSEKKKTAHSEEMQSAEIDTDNVEEITSDEKENEIDTTLEESGEQTQTDEIAESEYDEEDYFDDSKEDDEELELKLIEEKEKEEEEIKEEILAPERNIEDKSIELKAVPEPEEDDFDIIRDVSVLYPAASKPIEEIDPIETTQNTAEEKEDVVIPKVSDEIEVETEVQDIDAEVGVGHDLSADESDKEFVKDKANEVLEEGEFKTKSEEEVHSAGIIGESAETSDEIIPVAASPIQEHEILTENDETEDSFSQHASAELAEESASEEGDYIDKERVKRRNRLITTAFVVGSVLIIGFAVYFSMPVISKLIKERKAQERLDYIADSIANIKKIDFIKDSISSNSIVADAELNDTVYQQKDAENIVKEEVPAKTEEMKTEKKSESVKSVSNPYNAPRSYKSFITTERMVIGSSLTKFAKKYYGNATYWVYIYEANKDKIKDPNNVPTGIDVKIPNVNPTLVDPQNRESLNYALKLQSQYLQ